VTVHWPRVLGHAAIAFALAVLLVGLGVATFTSKTSYDAGRIAGIVAVAAAIAAGVASYLAQRGRGRAASLAGAAIAAVVVLAAALVPQLVHHEPRPTYTFTAADRAPLALAGARLRHPTLGFSLEKPPGFSDSPKLAQLINGKLGSDSVAYAYIDPDNHATLMILMLPATGGDTNALEHSLDDFVHGMTDNVAGAVVRERSVGSNTGRVQIQLKAGYLRAALHVIAIGSGWVHVIVVVGSLAPNTLVDVFSSFQP
jgi:hypothetical protein